MRALILALLALTIAPAPALPQTEPFRVLNQPIPFSPCAPGGRIGGPIC